jgi:methylenetetrahydrofolate dehydrogenase (NADP+) / methenyltetrahydrofolate cyclohydrolase
MPARILQGSQIAEQVKAEVAEEVRSLLAADLRPGLAAVLAGDNPASLLYVRNNLKTCAALGIYAEKHALPKTVSTDELLRLVGELNRRDDIDGILVELPLPQQVDHDAVMFAVSPAKDVDGSHPMNMGLLATRRPGLVPCTAAAVLELLRRNHIAVQGTEAVVTGRSSIVGRPTAILLTNANATVTLCHSWTPDLTGVCRRADLLVAATAKPGMITREFVKAGATVVDVGMHKITSREQFDEFFKGNQQREAVFARHGFTLIGDVHPEVAEVANAITPVPGGVGPLTVAMLMANIVKACKMRRGHKLPAVMEQV